MSSFLLGSSNILPRKELRWRLWVGSMWGLLQALARAGLGMLDLELRRHADDIQAQRSTNCNIMLRDIQDTYIYIYGHALRAPSPNGLGSRPPWCGLWWG